MEEPAFALRRVNISFGQNNVRSGELLILKNSKELSAHEKFKMSIHLTGTGLSDDSQFLEDIDVPREITLAELKDYILEIPSLTELARNLESYQYIRVREKQSNGFFGRIFREGNKTLK